MAHFLIFIFYVMCIQKEKRINNKSNHFLLLLRKIQSYQSLISYHYLLYMGLQLAGNICFCFPWML